MICQYSECTKEFVPERFNQVYCSPECRRLETNVRILEEYHYRRAARTGSARVCSIAGCETRLSRYNLDKVCNKCEAEMRAAEEKTMMEMMDDVREYG